MKSGRRSPLTLTSRTVATACGSGNESQGRADQRCLLMHHRHPAPAGAGPTPPTHPDRGGPAAGQEAAVSVQSQEDSGSGCPSSH